MAQQTYPYVQDQDPDQSFHCITCSDEALSLLVISVNEEANLALVSARSGTDEVDISLVDSVRPGDIVLVHGGVALSRVDALRAGQEQGTPEAFVADRFVGIAGN